MYISHNEHLLEYLSIYIYIADNINNIEYVWTSPFIGESDGQAMFLGENLFSDKSIL